MTPRCGRIIAIAMMLLAAGCGIAAKEKGLAAIGPYHEFSGRLLVMEPARRWQVDIDWRGDSERGHARLLHAASGRIVEIRWQPDGIWLRDNGAPAPAWQPISPQQLADHGIILPPGQLAAILGGEVPRQLKRERENRWQGRINGAFVKLEWLAERRKLTITDMTHGNRAILLISP